MRSGRKPGRPGRLVVALTTMILLAAIGCASDRRDASRPAASPGSEVTGVLVSVKDDRAADGGFDLILNTDSGARELVRVPSMFIAPPRDSVRAMHEVVEASKPGDRLRARGTRDETGALRAEVLERVGR